MAATKQARVIALIGVAALAACGSLVNSRGAPGSLNVGSKGGVVRSPDGVVVTVPPGALSSQVLIEITPVALPAPLPAGLTLFGSAYAVTPHGQQFTSPVTLVFPSPASGDVVVETLSGPGATAWTDVTPVLISGGEATVTANHFSFYAVARVTEPCVFENGHCGANSACAVSDGGSVCSCATGYQGDGGNCDPVDACATANGGCDTHAACTSTGPGTAACACLAGFQGDGFTCSAIDCDEVAPNCGNHTSCIPADAGPSCVCEPGYSADGGSCVPLGCQACDSNATCTQADGGAAVCTCNAHYFGDGLTCFANCDATPNPCPNATCSSNESTAPAVCGACKPGFFSDGGTCTPVSCGAGNGGCDQNATCTNDDDAGHCKCNSGYFGDGVTCCSERCPTYSTCVADDAGTESCQCAPYLAPVEDGGHGNCLSAEPCSVNNGGCWANSTCVSHDAGAPLPEECDCNAGYFFNGVGCSDIDECTVTPWLCDPNATCTNTVGSYTCACNAGFSGDGGTCTATPCSQNNGGCDVHAACSATPGGPHCTCMHGYQGDGFTCAAG